MKRILHGPRPRWCWLLVAVVVLRADVRRGGGWCGHGWRHPGPMSFVARQLKLNHAQEASILALWQTERPKISAGLHEFLAENREMNAIAVQANPDQSRIKEIADREAATIGKLLVEKMRLQSRIYSTVLTPEQRGKADEMQEKLQSRLDRVADHFATQPAEK